MPLSVTVVMVLPGRTWRLGRGYLERWHRSQRFLGLGLVGKAHPTIGALDTGTDPRVLPWDTPRLMAHQPKNPGILTSGPMPRG